MEARTVGEKEMMRVYTTILTPLLLYSVVLMFSNILWLIPSLAKNISAIFNLIHLHDLKYLISHRTPFDSLRFYD